MGKDANANGDVCRKPDKFRGYRTSLQGASNLHSQRGGLIDYRVPEALSGILVWAPPPASSHRCLRALWEEKGTSSPPSSSAHPKPRWAERGCPRLLRLGAHIFTLSSSLSFAHLTCCAPLCSDSQSQLAKTCRVYSCPVSLPNPIEGWSLPWELRRFGPSSSPAVDALKLIASLSLSLSVKRAYWSLADQSK